MRAVVMLVIHQLSSHGVDPALVDLFWMLAGAIGAVMMISVAWRVIRLALFLISWAIIILFGLGVMGHVAIEYMLMK
jgi:hypothetical protein